MPYAALRKETSRENGDLICHPCRQILHFKNRRNFDERPKVLAPTVYKNERSKNSLADVPKCEIFDCFHLSNFYTTNLLWLGWIKENL
jgi:hypothetical protein